MKKYILCLVIGLISMSASAQGPQNPLRRTDEAFFKTDEARRVGDQILLYQRCTGGWPKNIDMARPLSKEEQAKVLADKALKNDSTTDNGATNMQMWYLARLFRQTEDNKYSEGFCKGLDYLLSGQYANGGWPQFWPEFHVDYSREITFNDGAMINTLELIRAIYEEQPPFDGKLVPASRNRQLRKAFDKGVECILKTQIIKDGEPSVWCQQYDEVSLTPDYARAYELPSYCSAESAGIVEMLMQLPNPSKEVKSAIHGAMKWFDDYKLTGLRYYRTREDTYLAPDPDAGPIWARFYDLTYCEPYVCDRDGIMRRDLTQIGRGRRNGYAWYTNGPERLYPLYEKWAELNDPSGMVKLDPKGKGANETGLVQMNRKPAVDMTGFDIIVSPGESIQAAISKAPAVPTEPFCIFIKKGLYDEKVVIDRPFIVLVGEDKDSTIIRWGETAASQKERSYNGKPVGTGTLVFQNGADDCIISSLTVYNDFGIRFEHSTDHQFAIAGKGTRTIVINCNVWSGGSDTIALWPDGGGYSYHADLDVRSLGVDFLCPRGWCFVTRSRFTGAGHAIIWHDGHQDKDMKLVIKDSDFDAILPTTLGRFHHDSQFYLMNCRFSGMIKDENIHHAYKLVDGGTRAVLYDEAHDVELSKYDAGQWGRRVYYENCKREGGDSGWLRDNLDRSSIWTITAAYTFQGKWDPEKVIRDLWSVLAY